MRSVNADRKRCVHWGSETVTVDLAGRYKSSCGVPRGGELRMRKLKSHLLRTQSLNVLPLKPGVGQYIAIHATRIARDFFLVYFYTSVPFTCIFSKSSPDFSCLCYG